MDKISLHGVPLFARVGVPDEERAVPQRLLMDLTLELELEAAANTDDLRLTVDYKDLVNRLQAFAAETTCRLLETLTSRLCLSALEDPRILSAHIKLRKFPADLSGQVEDVSVEMTRSR